MARIPVEKRGGGFPWWAWLLIGLLLLALIWLLFSLLAGGGDDRVAAPPEPTEISAAAEPDATEATGAPTGDGEPTLEPADGVPALPALGTPTPVMPDSDPAEVATVIAAVTFPAGEAVPGPITDLAAILEERDKPSLAGRRVDLLGETAAEVRSVVGDTTFWVGPSEDRRVFVALSEEQDAAGAEGSVDVDEGQTVRITGEVRQLPSVEEAGQQWGLSEANAAGLENQQIYISAEQVEIVER